MGRDRTSFGTIMIPNNTIEDLVLTMDRLLGYTSPLVTRPMFFVAPEDHYSPMAEHITTDIKEVPSDALLPSKIEVQQHGLTDQPVVNIRDVNESFDPEGYWKVPGSTLSFDPEGYWKVPGSTLRIPMDTSE
jgi:hypothetical protein